LQPAATLNAAFSDDRETGVGSGLSDIELGLRLRYEITREIAPYVGVHWERKLGETADLAREEGGDASDLSFVVGVKIAF
jgi:copper resistance protein B